MVRPRTCQGRSQAEEESGEGAQDTALTAQLDTAEQPPAVLVRASKCPGFRVRLALPFASSLDSAEDRYPVRWPHLLPKPGLDHTGLCFQSNHGL